MNNPNDSYAVFSWLGSECFLDGGNLGGAVLKTDTIQVQHGDTNIGRRCWGEEIARNLSVNCEGGTWHECNGASGKVI